MEELSRADAWRRAEKAPRCSGVELRKPVVVVHAGAVAKRVVMELKELPGAPRRAAAAFAWLRGWSLRGAEGQVLWSRVGRSKDGRDCEGVVLRSSGDLPVGVVPVLGAERDGESGPQKGC